MITSGFLFFVFGVVYVHCDVGYVYNNPIQSTSAFVSTSGHAPIFQPAEFVSPQSNGQQFQYTNSGSQQLNGGGVVFGSQSSVGSSPSGGFQPNYQPEPEVQSGGGQSFGTQSSYHPVPQTGGGQQFGSQSTGGQHYATQSESSQSFGAQSGGSQSFGSQSGGNQHFGIQSTGGLQHATQSESSQRFGAPSGGSQSFGSQSTGGQQHATHTGNSQSFKAQSGSSQSFGSQSGGNQRFGSQSTGGKQSGGSQLFGDSSKGAKTVRKFYYSYRAPHEPEDEVSLASSSAGGVVLPQGTEEHYKIIFIQVPGVVGPVGSESHSGGRINLGKRIEEKTKVYVLLKEQESITSSSSGSASIDFPDTEPAKPEVVFIKYKSNKKINNVDGVSGIQVIGNGNSITEDELNEEIVKAGGIKDAKDSGLLPIHQSLFVEKDSSNINARYDLSSESNY